MSKRLFVALELPLPTRERLARLDPEIRGVRWTDVAHMHLTMSFLGDLQAGAEERMRDALAGVRVGSFFLPLTGVGKGHPHLFALHKRIQDAVLRAGLEPDLRSFHPHVTLGRAKDVSRHDLKAFLRKFEETEFDLVHVTGFALFSSVLAREGATHTLELRVDF